MLVAACTDYVLHSACLQPLKLDALTTSGVHKIQRRLLYQTSDVSSRLRNQSSAVKTKLTFRSNNQLHRFLTLHDISTMCLCAGLRGEKSCCVALAPFATLLKAGLVCTFILPITTLAHSNQLYNMTTTQQTRICLLPTVGMSPCSYYAPFRRVAVLCGVWHVRQLRTGARRSGAARLLSAVSRNPKRGQWALALQA